MNDTNLIDALRDRLEKFEPRQLVIEDESHRHQGHAGAAGGGGHYCVTIEAEIFRGRSLVACHRMIHEALAPWMGREIHALALHTRIPQRSTT